MKIKYNNKEYNKIKDLLADTTIANIDKFLFNNKKITLADFINLQEKENKKDASGSASNSGDYGSASNSGDCGSASNSGDYGSASNSGDWGSASNSGYRGSASNSGDCGSASNSGDWGISTSNAIFGAVSNKAGLYSLVTEFVFNDLKLGEGFPKEKVIKQNAKLLKFTKEMEGKYYTLLKNKIYEIAECDNIKIIITERKNVNGFNVLKGIETNDVTIYNKQRKLEDIEKIIVVEKDGIFSHGKTIEQAIADFRYKIANRDTSDFEYFKTTKEKISVNEIIKGYRVITGACEFGTKNFVENEMGNELKDSYTIKEALTILKSKNAYAVEKFEKFIKGE